MTLKEGTSYSKLASEDAAMMALVVRIEIRRSLANPEDPEIPAQHCLVKEEALEAAVSQQYDMTAINMK